MNLEGKTPTSYANYLAGYISDPSTIRVRVLNEFGRAPSIEQCRNLREQKVRERESLRSYLPCAGRYVASFRCGHAHSDDNIVLAMNGVEKCKTCEDARLEKLKREAEEREERFRREYEARLKAKLLLNMDRVKASEEASIEAGQGEGSRIRLVSDTLQAIADLFHITLADLKGMDRRRLFVDARAVAAKIFKDGGASYPQIARFLNRKDHTTIIHLCKVFEGRCRRDPAIMAIYDLVRGAA